jgi:hypothetical protein
MKPLFIPVNSEYYELFESNQKQTELRLYGRRWNEDTCYPGRPVVVSRGYGTASRLTGVIAAFSTCAVMDLPDLERSQFEACYGCEEDCRAARITLTLDCWVGV